MFVQDGDDFPVAPVAQLGAVNLRRPIYQPIPQTDDSTTPSAPDLSNTIYDISTLANLLQMAGQFFGV